MKVPKPLAYIIVFAPMLLVVLTPVTIWYLNAFHSSTRVCTVESAELISYSNDAPSTSVDIVSPDCGLIVVTRMKSPHGVNKARLTEVLNERSGERFEFVVKYVQRGDELGSFGVTSLSPVEE